MIVVCWMNAVNMTLSHTWSIAANCFNESIAPAAAGCACSVALTFVSAHQQHTRAMYVREDTWHRLRQQTENANRDWLLGMARQAC